MAQPVQFFLWNLKSLSEVDKKIDVNFVELRFKFPNYDIFLQAKPCF